MKCSACQGTGHVRSEAGDRVCMECVGLGEVRIAIQQTTPVPPGEKFKMTESQFGQFLKNSAVSRD